MAPGPLGVPVLGSTEATLDESVSLGPAASERASELIAEFQNRPDEIPIDNNRQNLASLQRNKDAHDATGPAGDAGVPESVREVISSSGQSLDASIQRAVEDRMGDSFGDVRIHTGPQAANACEEINARAFTVGNHIAFNSGEYDPESPEGQHLLAHELAHVRQQTGGALSMMPQANVELEIDPDPQLEREAEATAQRVMQGGELGIQRLADTAVHVQRADKTRREVLRGEVSSTEIAAGIEEASILSVDPDRFRDAYKLAEYATTLGVTQVPVQLLNSEYGLSHTEALAVTFAVGGSIHVGKDRLHREDIYLILEIARLLGAEERVAATLERMGFDIDMEQDRPERVKSRQE
ncbi:DUF4157 domain-containing protein [Halovivax cerinus]|uniref:DUF4157 domain-containing protein n=1 Tax=Halovivax cerinus TaxID=1487865 RepID=A0ABD5NMK2_9EURY|nr:DUF4157 domain-containing protein [Halovivax cerinus]